MKQASLLALSFFMTACALAQEVHLVSPGASVQAPLSPAVLSQRVQQAALRYQQYAPVPRFGVFDIAYPKDLNELTATGGFGIAVVVIHSQQSSELPLKRLYLRTGGEAIELTLLSSASSQVESSSLQHRVFGAHRWEALYTFPATQQQAGSELVADFQINRFGFVLSRFQDSGLSRTPGAENSKLVQRAPDLPALLELAKREFPGFVLSPISASATESKAF